MRSLSTLVLVVFLAMVAAGCGGGGGGGGSASGQGGGSGLSGQTGSLIIRQNLEGRTVAGSIDTVRIRGLVSAIINGVLYIDGGGAPYGPIDEPVAPTYVLEDVPVEVGFVRLEYLDDGVTVGVYFQEVTIRPNVPFEIVDPDYVDIAGRFERIEIVPNIFLGHRPGFPQYLPLRSPGPLMELVAYPEGGGEPVEMRAYAFWESDNPTVAKAFNGGPLNAQGASGYVEGQALGRARITATLADLRDTIEVEVFQLALPTLSDVTFSPDEPTLPLETTQQFTAHGRFSNNTEGDVTEQVEWVSSDPAILSVSNTPGQRGLATTHGTPGQVDLGVWVQESRFWRSQGVTVGP